MFLRVKPRSALWKKRCIFSGLSLREQSQNCCENICQLLWTLRGLFDGFHINQTRRPATIIFSTHNFCSRTLKEVASGLYISLIKILNKKSNCLRPVVFVYVTGCFFNWPHPEFAKCWPVSN